MDKAAEAPGRPMKFPYTFSAKLAQFPFKHYINNQWIWKYYLIACGLCVPVFYKIQKICKYFFVSQYDFINPVGGYGKYQFF